MFVYIPDWIMFYELEAFRYDKDNEAAILIVSGYRMEIVIKNVSIGKFKVIRNALLFNVYFELSKEYDWTISML